MNLTTKKIIAKEFIILLLCSLTFPIAFLGTVIFNTVYEGKIKDINNKLYEINPQVRVCNDSIEPYLIKDKSENRKKLWENLSQNLNQIEYSDFEEKYINIDSIKTLFLLYDSLSDKINSNLPKMRPINAKPINNSSIYDNQVQTTSTNSIDFRYLYFELDYFSDIIAFQDTSRINRLNYFQPKLDSLVNIQSKLETKVANCHIKVLSNNRQKKFSLVCFLLILTIMYPIRLLFLALRWSIKTLRSKP